MSVVSIVLLSTLSFVLLLATRTRAEPDLLLRKHVIEQASLSSFPRPPVSESARFARWLVHSASWGVLTTLSVHLRGAPFGDVFSYADGAMQWEESSGIPYFYMSPLEYTVQDIQHNSTCSLIISEEAIPKDSQSASPCTSTDPQDPTCAKVTLSGTLVPVSPLDIARVRSFLFDRHPAMKDWPSTHDWTFYQMNLEKIYLLDTYGGPAEPTVKDYLAVHFR